MCFERRGSTRMATRSGRRDADGKLILSTENIETPRKRTLRAPLRPEITANDQVFPHRRISGSLNCFYATFCASLVFGGSGFLCPMAQSAIWRIETLYASANQSPSAFYGLVKF